jgi:adenosylmethionine-8-amino-7-oxononanoate aminotransferase
MLAIESDNRSARLARGPTRRALPRGLTIRAIGNVIAFCPPPIITPREIDELLDRFGMAPKRLLARG